MTRTGDAQAWWTLALLVLALVVSFMDRQALNLVVDPVRRDLGISEVQIGLLQGGAFALFFTAVGLPIGRAVDVSSRKWILISGILVWSVATLGSGLALGFGGLFLARVFMGIGESTLLPAGTSLIAEVFPPARRATAIAIFFLGTVIGAAVANLVGGILLGVIARGAFQWLPVIGQGHPWRVLFCLLALPGFALSGVLLSLREPPRATLVGTAPRTGLRDALSQLWNRRHVLAPLYASIGLTALWSLAIVSWTPTLLSRVFGESLVQLGTQLGASGFLGGFLGVLVGGPVGDWLTRRHGLRGRISAAIGATGLGVPSAFLGGAHNPWAVVILFGWMCATTAASGALVATAIQDAVTAETRGIAAAIINVFTTVVGLTLGPGLVAIMTEHVFRNPLMLGCSLLYVAAPAAILATMVLLPILRAYPEGALQSAR